MRKKINLSRPLSLSSGWGWREPINADTHYRPSKAALMEVIAPLPKQFVRRLKTFMNVVGHNARATPQTAFT